jgi:FMN phosphatase YigB (HAD superfamily)
MAEREREVFGGCNRVVQVKRCERLYTGPIPVSHPERNNTMKETVNTPAFILTEDTGALWRKLANRETQMLPGVSEYYSEITGILTDALNENGIPLRGFLEETIDSALSQKARSILATNENSLCICLDRFLLESVESDPEWKNKFIRFSVCRMTSGERVSRQAAPEIATQIQVIKDTFPDISRRTILLVDDGIFSGGTVMTVIEYLSTIGIRKEQCIALGFIGNSASEKFAQSGIQTEILRPIENLYDWVDLRDFSIIGGKMLNKSTSGMVSTAIPYLYPWSSGEGASFDMFGNFFTVSKKIIDAQIKLFQAWETTLGRPLRFIDLIRAGFPFPTDIKKTIPVTRNNRVIDYLYECKNRITEEEQREVVIFDMDGTLYQLDGVDNRYKGSSLERRVITNALAYMSETEQCTTDEATRILINNSVDMENLSTFLTDRYGITREQYFNRVWDIESTGLIRNFDSAVCIVKQLAANGTKLILVTSAPKIWQERVCGFLGISECFECVYTAEQFKEKKEIFTVLAGRYDVTKIISVGDQKQTDIEPAEQLGMKSLLINSPEDLERIVI